MGPQIQLSDFVGDHGPYQLYITVLLFIRYVTLGLMANSGPLMTPDVTFYCQLPMEEIVAIMPNITTLNQTEQGLEIREEFKRICQLDLHLYQQAYLNSSPILPVTAPARRQFNSTDKIRECSDFTYDIAPDQGRTMTSEFDLVCDRDWLRSLFQSLISAAIVIAHVFWGTFSDKYGRFRAQKLCLIVSLLAGLLSVFAMEFWTFVIARALCSFSDLGLVVSLTTTVVELVGNQYRGLSVALVNFGSALGVTVFPYIVAYYEDFRKVVAFTVMCHIVTMPFLWTNNESVRWLLTNRKFNLAKRELKRIGRWNRKSKLMKQRVFSVFNCIGPSLGAGGDGSGCSNEQPSSSSNKDKGSIISSSKIAEEKRAFEILFNNFLDQIESQNFCDPLGAKCSEIDSPQPSDTTGASLDCQLPATANAITSAEATSAAVAAPNTRPPNQELGPVECLKMPQNCYDGDRMSNSACRLDMYQGEKLQGPKVEGVCDYARMNLGNNVKMAYSFSHFGRAESCQDLQDDHLDGQLRPLADGDRDTFKSSGLPLNLSRSPGISHRLGNRVAKSATIDVVRAGAFPRIIEEPRIRRQPTQHPDCINLVASQLSFMGRVNRLFRDKQLMIAVFTIVWTTFNSELQYTSFIIINLEVGEDVYLNYILGGCMEALAAIIASLLLSYAPRRHSLIIFWLLISLSCFGLSVAHIDSTWAVWLLALAKFSQSCLSSVASVAAFESFPTFLRQSGSGLVFTLGMLGSVFAPLIFAEFDDQVGMDRVLMTFSFSSLTAAILIYLYLKETSNCELQ